MPAMTTWNFLNCRTVYSGIFFPVITIFNLVINISIKYESCPESIQPFWVYRQPVAWPWCDLADSQRRPYCESVNSHSPVGLVSRQWDAINSACVLCDRRIHESPSFQRRIKAWEKPEVAGSQIWAVGRGGAGWQTWVMWCFAQNACMRAAEWAGAWLWWSWSAHSVIVNVTVTQYTSSVNSVSLSTD